MLGEKETGATIEKKFRMKKWSNVALSQPMKERKKTIAQKEKTSKMPRKGVFKQKGNSRLTKGRLTWSMLQHQEDGRRVLEGKNIAESHRPIELVRAVKGKNMAWKKKNLSKNIAKEEN